MRTYSIRPERQAHALLGVSAGGYGAMAIALKHRDLFGVGRHPRRAAQSCATTTCDGPLRRRLRPGHLPRADRVRPRHDHRPLLLRAAPPAGEDVPRTGLRRRARHDRQGRPRQPGRPPRRRPTSAPASWPSTSIIPGRDNYNFDAQDQSFAWLAARRGVAVELIELSPGPPQPALHRARRAARLPLARPPHPAAGPALTPVGIRPSPHCVQSRGDGGTPCSSPPTRLGDDRATRNLRSGPPVPRKYPGPPGVDRLLTIPEIEPSRARLAAVESAAGDGGGAGGSAGRSANARSERSRPWPDRPESVPFVAHRPDRDRRARVASDRAPILRRPSDPARPHCPIPSASARSGSGRAIRGGPPRIPRVNSVRCQAVLSSWTAHGRLVANPSPASPGGRRARDGVDLPRSSPSCSTCRRSASARSRRPRASARLRGTPR